MMAELSKAPVGEREIKMLIQELVRSAMAQMLARQEAAFDPAESAAHMTQLDEQRARVMAAQRARDWSLAEEIGAPPHPGSGCIQTHWSIPPSLGSSWPSRAP